MFQEVDDSYHFSSCSTVVLHSSGQRSNPLRNCVFVSIWSSLRWKNVPCSILGHGMDCRLSSWAQMLCEGRLSVVLFDKWSYWGASGSGFRTAADPNVHQWPSNGNQIPMSFYSLTIPKKLSVVPKTNYYRWISTPFAPGSPGGDVFKHRKVQASDHSRRDNHNVVGMFRVRNSVTR